MQRIQQMTIEEDKEDQRALLLEARRAIRRSEFLHHLLSYLLLEWPMAKRVIDLEIEINKELTTYINALPCQRGAISCSY